MNKKLSAEIGVIVLLSLILSSALYILNRHETTSPKAERDSLSAPISTLPDTLRVVTLSGSSTYFLYRDEPMGYQYELVSLIAEQLHLPMTIEVAPNTETMLSMLDSGKVDLCITPQAETKASLKKWRFVGPEQLSGLVLVQRKSNDSAYLVDRVTDLADKTITITDDARYKQRLQHLSEQIGSPITYKVMAGDTITDEDLMADVANNKVDYTIADELMANLVRTYYANLNVRVDIGFRQKLKWIVCPESSLLATKIDSLAKMIPDNVGYKSIYKRYFELSKGVTEEPVAMYNKGLISPFDDLFKKQFDKIKPWPWQLLASIAFKESNFKPKIIGWSGARGLMGIMPSTGRIYGASKPELLDPAVSVRVSVECLLTLRNRYFKNITDSEQQLKLVLAAYNAGIGHITDARRLAEKYGYKPDVWDGNVEECVRMKREPKYYNDPVCKAGYLRATETLGYVKAVYDRMHQYMNKTGK